MSLWEDIFGGGSKKSSDATTSTTSTDNQQGGLTISDVHPTATTNPTQTTDAATATATATQTTDATRTVAPTETEPNGLEQYGQQMWGGLLNEASAAWQYFDGNQKNATQLSDSDFDALNFNSAYGPTTASADASTTARAGDSAAATVADSTSTKTGSDAKITSSNGTTTFQGCEDGNNVDIQSNKNEATISAGGFSAIENKANHSSYGTSGSFQWSHANGVDTVTNVNNDTTGTFNSRTHRWGMKEGGQDIAGGDSATSTTQTIVDGQVQTTTGNAGQAAQAAAVTQAATGGDQQSANPSTPEYKIYADTSGDFGIVSKNGMVIKTDKATKEVTISVDGHNVRMGPNHSVQVEQTGANGQDEWVNVKRGQKIDLSKDVQLNGNGEVTVNGQTVVDGNNNITLSKGTKIDTTNGQMESSTTKGKKVNVSGGQGQTTVQTEDTSTVKSTAKGTTVTDSHGKEVAHIDAQSQQMVMSDGHGGSANLGFNGSMDLVNDNGQRSVIGADGSINSWDAQGNSLFSMDAAGDITTYDGTVINADGTYEDADGSGDNSLSQAESGGVSADGMIGAAASAVAAAEAGAATGKSNAGMLDGLAATLGAAAAQFTAEGKLDVVAQIDAAESMVEGAKGNLGQNSQPKPQLAASSGQSSYSDNAKETAGSGPAAA